jgi:DNA-binding MarR family transcriptional regulator
VSTTDLVEGFLRIANLYAQAEGEPSDYGTGALLTRTEIHTVEAVGNHPGCNVTLLAQVMGVSKSAASQTLSRLKAKDLVEQSPHPEGGRETALNLTASGRQAYKRHAQGHKRLYEAIDAQLASIDPATKTRLAAMLSELEAQLSKWVVYKRRK